MLTRKQSNQLSWAHLQSEEISKSVDDVSKTIDLSEKHEILPNYPSAKTHYNNLDLLPDNPAPKRKRPKFIRRVKCQVCYDLANDHIHYGAISCYSCRAFFRRAVNSNADYFCSQNKNCVVTKHTRKHCQYCRFVKCLSVGMKSSWVMTEEDKKEKKEKAFIKKVKLKTCQLHRVSTKSKKSQQSFNKHTNSIKKEDNNGTTSSSSLRVPTLSEHIIPPRIDPSCLSSSLLSSHENPAQQSFTFSSASSPYSSMNRSLSCSPITMSNNTDALLSTHHSPREHSEFPGSPIVGTLSYGQSMNSSPIYKYLNTISSSSLQNHLYNNGRSNELSPPSKQSHISNTYALNPEISMSNQSYYNFNSSLRQKDPLEPPSISQSNYSPKNNHGELFSYSPLSGKSSPQLAKTEKIPPSLCKKFMDNETLPELLVNSNFPIDLSQKYTSVVDSCNYKIHPSEILTNLSTVSKYETGIPKNLKNAGFSDYECNLISNIMISEEESSKLIPLRSETMATMINCSYSNKTFPQDVCLEGYLVCMRRIIRLSSMLDFFTCFSMEDQKALLLTNTDMIVNIRTARFFQHGVHFKKHIFFVNNTDDDPKYGRMDTFQIFQSPWACSDEDEKKYNDLMKKIFDLQLDEISTVLISMMSLFSSNNAKIHDELRANKTQEFFTNLMKKYIIHHVGKDAACQLLPKYIFMIAHLEEMAQVMVSKRLNI